MFLSFSGQDAALACALREGLQARGINVWKAPESIPAGVEWAAAIHAAIDDWKVDDRATAAFMESFYNKLKAGQPRADALAATQQEFRNHANTGWRHPYVWAAFQLSGDWAVMRW